MKQLIELWNKRPLYLILLAGIFFRLLAVLFSKGFGMHDDHFLIIESSQSWVDGYDYNNWLPDKNSGKITPSGHSFFYTGIHYFLFKFLKSLGMLDAQAKMYIVRFLHALLSLSIIYYGYRITRKLSDEHTAKMAGIMLSIFWFMPFMSVRNLIEFVCIAPLIYATWLAVKYPPENKKVYFAIGLLMGIAFSIRFQTIIFAFGFGLALLFQRKFIQALLFAFSYFLCDALVQGLTDYYIWGQPFVEFKEYIRYNMENANNYISQEWYMYLLLISGILIPPISLFLLFGFFRNWKKQLLLFLPSFMFLVFHCYFPNKQERFIMPIIPFIIILGSIGWFEFYNQSTFWQIRKKLMKNIWIWFWILNTIPLIAVSVAYSKRSRVESMVYLSHKEDIRSFIIEESTRGDFLLPTQFYLEKWIPYRGITNQYTIENYYEEVKNVDKNQLPNYVVFVNKENIEKRVTEFKKFFPTLEYEATIEPSFIDKLLHFLNPVNKNQTCYIYKL